MHAHYLQHVPFEELGAIKPWLDRAGYTISSTQMFKPVEWPDEHKLDLLVIMGGPMSANDKYKFSWLAEETRFIRRVIESGIPVLGICLGAQLIASALGARVYPSPVKEIGWFPVRGVEATVPKSFEFPRSVNVFHWHGETFALPPGAELIATSEVCENQAFQYGSNVMGLQFHLETTPKSAQQIITHCRDELVSGAYVQTEQEILLASSDMYSEIHQLMGKVLTHIISK